MELKEEEGFTRLSGKAPRALGTAGQRHSDVEMVVLGRGAALAGAVRSEAHREGLECRLREGWTCLCGGPQLHVPEVLLIARWIDHCLRE